MASSGLYFDRKYFVPEMISYKKLPGIYSAISAIPLSIFNIILAHFSGETILFFFNVDLTFEDGNYGFSGGIVFTKQKKQNQQSIFCICQTLFYYNKLVVSIKKTQHTGHTIRRNFQ